MTGDLSTQPSESLPIVPVAEHPVAVYLAGLSEGSRRTMLSALDTIARMASGEALDSQGFPWHQLRPEHTSAIRAGLAERYAPATANKMLAGLRGVLKACWRLGLMDSEQYHRARDVASVRGSTLPSGRSLSPGELRALFTVCGDDLGPAGRRDSALLSLLYGCGLRRSEAVALDLNDYEPEDGALTVRGKGNKQRIVYAGAGSRGAIDDWITFRGDSDGPLLVPVNKGGRFRYGRRMSNQAVYGILRKRAGEAGISQLSPHDLRRSFVSDLLDAGADLSIVQKLAGHANVNTTQRYDRRSERAKRRASELLHIPFAKGE